VPSFGIKLDAIPGRFNYVQTHINREAIFYGQCSELCGLAHAYMPIVVQSVDLEEFITYCTLYGVGADKEIVTENEYDWVTECNTPLVRFLFGDDTADSGILTEEISSEDSNFSVEEHDGYKGNK
jgi:hypothetical protein